MNHPTMTNHTSTTQTDEEMKKRTGVVKGMDENDPNDMAFKLVTMFVYLLCCEYSLFLPFLSFFYEVQIPPPLLLSFNAAARLQQRGCCGSGGSETA
jgi:hypothetical protein